MPKRINNLNPTVVMHDFIPTHWGKASLATLPGVGDFLRKNEMEKWEDVWQKNILAEEGPQDLESRVGQYRQKRAVLRIIRIIFYYVLYFVLFWRPAS